MLDMFFKACMLGCRAAKALMEANVKLLPDQVKILDDPQVSKVSGQAELPHCN